MSSPQWHAIGTVPGEVAARLTHLGWQRSTEGGLGILWCGEDWRSALDILDELGDRATEILVVGDRRPSGMGTRVRKRGGLGCCEHPIPDWLLAALADTLDRAARSVPMGPLRQLVGFDSTSETALESFLQRLAASTRSLGATAGVWQRGAQDADFYAVTEDVPSLPGGLLDSAMPIDAPTVIPNTSVSVECQPTDRVQAAMALVLSRQDTAEVDRVLVLTWPTPFVPTSGELQLAQLLTALGRSTIQRIADRKRLVEAHNNHVDALAELVPPRPGASSPSLEHFVTSVLETHAPDPRIRTLHIQLSAHSRDEPRWVSWWRHDCRPSGPRIHRSASWPATLPSLSPPPEAPLLLDDGHWATAMSVGEDVHGLVVAITDTKAAALGVQPSVRNLARDLGLGAVLERWSADTTALMSLSRDQTHDLDPANALCSMLDRLRQRMKADGARLHVVRRAGHGHKLETLASRPELGIPGPTGSLQKVLEDDHPARVETPVSQHLLVPLHALGATAAIIEVWRESSEAFDESLDSDALRRFAPHVAAAARRILHDEMLTSRVERMSELMQHIAPDLPLHHAAAEAVRQVGELVGAAAAVLMRRVPGPPRSIYVEAAWCIDSDLLLTIEQATSAAAQTLSPDDLPDDISWGDEVADAMTPELHAWGLESTYRPRITISAPTPQTQPTSAILLLDAVASDSLPDSFAPDIQDVAAAEFVHYTTALLEAATRNAARACADRLATTKVEPDAICAEAAESLQRATGAEAVMIALGDQARLRVRTVVPDRPSLIGRELNTEDGLDDSLLRDLAAAYGWNAVRSSAQEYIVDRRRLGSILLLSGPDGPTIGWHRRQVLKAVAKRIALELDNAQRRAMLVDLNTLAGKLAGLVGEELGGRVVETVEEWVREYVRADAQIAVVARVSKEQPLLVTGSTTLSNEDLRELHLTSSRWGLAEHLWTRDSDREIIDIPLRDGLAVPITLPENKRLSGHLFIFTSHALNEAHMDVAREAARELSVVLDGERVRHGLMAQTGLFRHALLSPVQGLTDAAGFIAHLSTLDPIDHDLIAEQRKRVDKEAETIRRWKLIQKLYGGGILGNEIKLNKRRHDLRPVVERCAERYRHRSAERDIALFYEFDMRGRPMVDMDETAMDLILSNLIENAVKYAFSRRHITVGVHEDKAHYYIWVEDMGHALPNDIDIYETGARLDWEDPTRVIHGEGMGLAIARSLIRAHGGDIGHTCKPQSATGEGREDTRPYKVRFTLTLPRASR